MRWKLLFLGRKFGSRRPSRAEGLNQTAQRWNNQIGAGRVHQAPPFKFQDTRLSAPRAFHGVFAMVNNPDVDRRIVIVGAGPTGLALACDLLSRGMEVDVIDKAAHPATTSRALGLQPRGREILARLGALGDLPERAVHALATNVYVGTRLVTRFMVENQFGKIHLGPLLISQAEIEGQLRKRLKELGGEVRWNHELISATQNADGVQLGVRAQNIDRETRAAWLIGCDGAHSELRRIMGVQFEGMPFPETLILADVKMEWNEPSGEGMAWLHPDGLFLVVPLPGGITRVVAELSADNPLAKAGQSAMTAVTVNSSVKDSEVLDRLRTMMKERTGGIAAGISDPSWISVFRFHRRLASAYRNGRMLIAGDAAHTHSALGGQGMNTGLGDAFNLGWKLASTAKGQASEGLLDTYEAERRPVAAHVVKDTSRIWNIAIGRTQLDRFIRDYLFFPALRIPTLQHWAIESGSQLKINYRGGPLARTSFATRLAYRIRRVPMAGDRCPDAHCLDLRTGAETNFGEQSANKWTLIVFNNEPRQRLCVELARSCLGTDLKVVLMLLTRSLPSQNNVAKWPDAVLEDRAGEIARAWRPANSSAILLRPDGHIGWRSENPDDNALRKWLRLVLARDKIESHWVLSADPDVNRRLASKLR
jgi:4,5-epoxidase